MSPDGADLILPGVFLLIPAGGKGLRMGGEIPKQFRDWRGTPLLQATIQAFFVEGMPAIQGIGLAVPPENLSEVRAWRFGAPLWAAEGGDTRQASVSAALALLPDNPEALVMIHDGVRPFPPRQPLYEALEAVLEGWDGSLLGEPSTDTLKRVDAGGAVVSTEPRDFIFRAQTPQIARLGTWRQAFAWAQTQGFTGSDDVSLLEARGMRVKLVPSPSTNFKITHPEDWKRLEG